MNIKKATYKGLDGTKFTVEYDADAPCWMCNLPVGSASVGGTVICPACDCGKNRDGTSISYRQLMKYSENFRLRKTKEEVEQVIKDNLI